MGNPFKRSKNINKTPDKPLTPQYVKHMLSQQAFSLRTESLIAALTVLKEKFNFSPEQLKSFSDDWLEQSKKAGEVGDGGSGTNSP